MTSSTSQQQHDAHAVPCGTLHSLRRRAVHRHDSESWARPDPLVATCCARRSLPATKSRCSSARRPSRRPKPGGECPSTRATSAPACPQSRRRAICADQLRRPRRRRRRVRSPCRSAHDGGGFASRNGAAGLMVSAGHSAPRHRLVQPPRRRVALGEVYLLAPTSTSSD